jgi:hypothetical protein
LSLPTTNPTTIVLPTMMGITSNLSTEE